MAEDPNLQPPEQPKDELLKLFEEEERNYFRRLIDMCKGLGQPRDSIEFKKAIIELQRLGAPIAAVLIIVTAVVTMCLIKITVDEPPPVIQTDIIEPEETEKLEEIEEPPPPEEQTPPEEITEVTDVVVDIDAPPSPSAEQSPQPSPVDAVSMTPSPVQIKGVFGSRSPGVRGNALGRYGASGTEVYVLGFLRYLKKMQRPDGSWEPQGNDKAGKVGDTSLALLCFLAHGELPGQSAEFGETVEKAIRYLINDQIKTEEEARSNHGDAPRSGGKHAWRRGEIGYFKGRDPCNYAHLTAVYALSEAYAMTRIPDIKPVLERAIPHIYNGQNASGGWYYNLDASCPIIDSSYVSWAVQALKAAKLAGIHDRKIVEALKKAARGIRDVKNSDGSFGYCNNKDKGRYKGLTAPSALILQMLDEADSADCKAALAYMKDWEPTFQYNHKATSTANPMAEESPQYYCYYLSQVRFNQGEKNPEWLTWSKKQILLYSNAQITIPKDKSGYKDHKGQPQAITYWPHVDAKYRWGNEGNSISDTDRLKGLANSSGKRGPFDINDLVNRDRASWSWHNSPVIGSCFTALQLMVYYRNSPLSKGALTKIEEETTVDIGKESGDNQVTVEGLDDL